MAASERLLLLLYSFATASDRGVTKPTITQQNKFVAAENRYRLNTGHMNQGMKIT
jgi:hypothetical protein